MRQWNRLCCGTKLSRWGHRAARRLLGAAPGAAHTKGWDVVVQCSSVGSLGREPAWLEGEFGRSLAGGGAATPPVKLVYPARSDVLASYDGVLGGGCLPYSRATHVKQVCSVL